MYVEPVIQRTFSLTPGPPVQGLDMRTLGSPMSLMPHPLLVMKYLLMCKEKVNIHVNSNSLSIVKILVYISTFSKRDGQWGP